MSKLSAAEQQVSASPMTRPGHPEPVVPLRDGAAVGPEGRGSADP
jgi:hypothetical protein